MRGVIWLLLLAVVATVAAITLGSNDGLVTIHWSAWRADLSLNLFVLLVVGAGLLVMTAARVVDALLTLPRRAAEWRALQRERSAHQALREAHLELAAARYSRADKAAQRILQYAQRTASEPRAEATEELQLIGALLSAESLHRLQNREGRNQRLEQAVGSAEAMKARSGADGVRLLAAGWALEDRDVERARHWLGQLSAGAARRTQALRLKLQAARLAGRVEDALQTARLLAKHQAFSPAAAEGLLHSLASQLLDSAHDIDQLRRHWASLDSADRRHPMVASHAARRAAALGAAQDGRAWVRPLWDRLADLAVEERQIVALALADARDGLGPDWLPALERASAALPDDPAVAAAVGLGLAERGLWGKARRPLERAAGAPDLPARVRRSAWRELARVARGEGDEARAIACEQAGAMLD